MVDAHTGATGAATLRQDHTISIVVPTRNEEGNVVELVSRVTEALGGRGQWEIVFVDDSDDSTVARIQELSQRLPVRIIHRPPDMRRSGLGGAVLRGIAASRGDVIVVMDADLQHPPELVPRLVAVVALGVADVVIASRFVPGASADGLDGPWRHIASACTRCAAHLAVPRCRGIRDPLSGCFAVKRRVVASGPRRSEGFKVLLDVLAQGTWASAAEVPFRLERRQSGTSKAGLREGRRFIHQLVRIRLGSAHPDRARGRAARPAAFADGVEDAAMAQTGAVAR